MKLYLLSLATMVATSIAQLPPPYGYPLHPRFISVKNRGNFQGSGLNFLGSNHANLKIAAGSDGSDLFSASSPSEPSVLLLLLQPESFRSRPESSPDFRSFGLGPRNLRPIGPPAPGPHVVPKPPFAPPKFSPSQTIPRASLGSIGLEGLGGAQQQFFIIPVGAGFGRTERRS